MKKMTVWSIAALSAVAGSLSAVAAGARPCSRILFEPLPRTMLYGDPVHVKGGKPFAKDMTVIRHGGRYLMYYSVYDFPGDERPKDWRRGCWGTAVAASTNLVDWTRLADVRIDGFPGVWAGAAPCVKKFGGTIHLFHQSPYKEHNVIWHATSDDGLSFRCAKPEPAFVPNNAWSIARAIDAEVYRVGDRLILLFATRERPGAKIQQIGMAWAPWGASYDAGSWTEITLDAPLLKPERPWEMHCVEAPAVLFRDGIWYLFYAGAYNHEKQQIGVAWSADGVRFTRYSDDPVFPHGAPGSWNAAESGHPGIFEDDDGQTYLFFQGKETLNGNYRLSCVRVKFEK